MKRTHIEDDHEFSNFIALFVIILHFFALLVEGKFNSSGGILYSVKSLYKTYMILFR